MKQYNSIKAKHPDALLLFRVGDFYETFGEDAIRASKILGIVLTKRANGSASHIELAGFPHHALDTYLPKLVRAGERVAICDQLEDPKETKTIVRRGVTELVTPGVTFSDKVLDHKSNNFLAAVSIGKDLLGISFIDISTGEFLVAEGKKEYIDKLLQSFDPKEVLYAKPQRKKYEGYFGDRFYSYKLDDWVFGEDYTEDLLLKHFAVRNLKGFGLEGFSEGITAAGVILHYLKETQHNDLNHLTQIHRIEEENYVWMDRFTIRNLELLFSPHQDARTLFDVLDRSHSPMGSRLLKRWIAMPLKDMVKIKQRHDAVEFLLKNSSLSDELEKGFKEVGDLERLIGKIATAKINPRELNQLKEALKAIHPLKEQLLASKSEVWKSLADRMHPCIDLLAKIENTIQEDPPVLVAKGSVICEGCSSQLDDYRAVSMNGKDMLVELKDRELEKTGIPSLKIGFNNVFGYYLEVTNTHKSKVPEVWSRKQTLVNSERYITAALKELEEKILRAEEHISDIELKLYSELVLHVQEYIEVLQSNAQVIGTMDVLNGFARLAEEWNYSRPHINDGFDLNIKEGRHPVIEQQLPIDEPYVSNDLLLTRDDQQLIMITGPNMSGKSALLRQSALICLLAQMGSFVPAKSADIGLVDKIFVRVGASDNISLGESTFMVEMNETASILNNLSDRSLLLLDEIGRGTSTYDGISIAWAIAEYLHYHPWRPKTLFATHYHELNEMTHDFPRIKNFNVSVLEKANKVIFLRKLVEGGSEHSFGIHVARMAGMPASVIGEAQRILKRLEKSHSNAKPSEGKEGVDDDMQLSFFKLDDPILEDIREEIIATDINSLTPVEALLKLNEIKKLLGS